MAGRRPPTVRELAARLDDLEGALSDERVERLSELAEIDDELEEHVQVLGAHAEELGHLWQRLKWLEKRFKVGRPRKKKR